MQHTVTHCGQRRVELWEEAAPGTDISGDGALVLELGQTLRLAVIDGVSPTADSRNVGDIDAAVWAAGVLGTALRCQRPAADCLRHANELLYDRSQPVGRAQRQAAAVVADIRNGIVELVRAMDCEAWCFDGASWRAVFPGGRFKPATEAAYRRWLTDHPDASRSQMYDAEETLFGAYEGWQTTAVGRFAQPLFQTATLSDVKALVLASDGARLDAARVAGLPGWLAELREYERAYPQSSARKSHDDVTVISLSG